MALNLNVLLKANLLGMFRPGVISKPYLSSPKYLGLVFFPMLIPKVCNPTFY